MTPHFGNIAARQEFRAALSSGQLHQAWLIAGPQGVGKARFAQAAALRMLAEAAAEPGLAYDYDLSPESRTAALARAGAHPDLRHLTRLAKDPEKKPDEFARSITIAQIRALHPLFATVPSLSSRRVVVIDSIDDLERPGASNALLKSLEEPPSGTVFLLVSHAPGRLLPTIRSRCRMLRFGGLSDAEMRSAIRAARPDVDDEELGALLRAGAGSPGRALAHAGLDMAAIDSALSAIAHEGDTMNTRRLALARSLSGKTAQPRYEAFLDRVPGFIAEQARDREGEALKNALDAHVDARALASSARALSLDAHGSVVEMAGIVSRLMETR